MGFCKKLLSQITVEPVILLYMISFGMDQVIRPELLLFKACVNRLDYTIEECQQVVFNETNSTIMDNVSKVVSNYESNLSLAAFAPKFLFALLAGHWSDVNGRKVGNLPINILKSLLAILLFTWQELHTIFYVKVVRKMRYALGHYYRSHFGLQ